MMQLMNACITRKNKECLGYGQRLDRDVDLLLEMGVVLLVFFLTGLLLDRDLEFLLPRCVFFVPPLPPCTPPALLLSLCLPRGKFSSSGNNIWCTNL